MKKKLLVLADNLATGGARLAEGIIESSTDNEFQIFVLHSGNLNLTNLDSKADFRLVARSNPIRELASRIKVVNEILPDVVLNLTNFPLPRKIPAFKHKFAEILLFQNLALIKLHKINFADILSPSLIKVLIRKLLFRFSVSLSDVSCTVTQTEWVRQQLSKHSPQLFRKSSYVTKILIDKINTSELQNRHTENSIADSWFYPAAYYPHKRHRDLIELAEFIRHEKLNIKILLTLDPDYPGVQEYLSKVQALGLQNILVNLGWLTESQTRDYYVQAKGLFFPSDFESLGLPLLEAIAFNKPIVAADIPTTREIAGLRAQYFQWNNRNIIKEIAELLSRVPSDSQLRHFPIQIKSSKFLEYFRNPLNEIH